MIIRCRKCETSFRFDDQVMTGEGVWVRCGHCKDVFFQDNPFPEEPAGRPAAPDHQAAAPVSVEIAPPAAPALVIEPESGATLSGQVSDAKVLSRMKDIQAAIDDAATPGTFVKEFDDMAIVESEATPEATDNWRQPVAAVQKKKHPLLKAMAYIVLILLVNIALAGIYIGIVPEGRQRVADFLSPYCPWAEELIGPPGPVWRHAGLQDVRQHFVNNWLMGNLRVVEGSVVNKGKYPLAHVQVRGRLYDKNGSIIGEWISFGGKLLTDAELATLSEGQLKHMLSDPLVGNEISDRLNPNGQMPFMVVIASHDQQAVGKTTVMVSGAEKLLE